MAEITPSEDCKFFEHGSACLELCDSISRQALVRVCMPCSLFQTVTPQLLGNGTIDELRIKNPISFWIPKLTKERFIGQAALVEGIDIRTNAAIKEEVERIGKIFAHLQDYLIDPSDLVPILPLGTYITFIYRCKIDNVLSLLEGINSIKVVGVHEFQWALATVLHQALLDFEKITKRLILNKKV